MHLRPVPKRGRLLRVAGVCALVLAVPLLAGGGPARGQAETAAKLARGTADFLKERFESEAERLFLDGLARGVCEGRKVNYFVKFCGFYNEFGKDAVYSSYPTLVAALRQDVHEIPLALLTRLGKQEDGGTKGANMVVGFTFLKSLGKKLRAGWEPVTQIAGLADDNTIQNGCDSANTNPAKKGNPFCGLIAFSLFAELSQTYQIIAADAERGNDKAIAIEEVLFKFCAVAGQNKFNTIKKLVAERLPGCETIGRINIDSWTVFQDARRTVKGLSSKSAQLAVKLKLAEARKETEEITRIRKELRAFGIDPIAVSKIIDSPKAAEDVQKIFKALEEFREHEQALRLLIARGRRVEELLQKTSRQVRRVVAVIEYASFSVAVLDTFKILTPAAKAHEGFLAFRKHLDLAREMAALAAERKFTELLLVFGEQLKSHDQQRGDELKRYLAIMFDLAGADDADAVSEILDRAAAPVGAWRLKSESSFFGVNAFVGASFGIEKLLGVGENKFVAVTSVFAPIGLDWSWPLDARTGAQGILFSFLDFGNLLSFRGRDNAGKGRTVEDQPDEEFKNLVSFGLYYHRTMSDNTGAAWGFGVSRAPRGRVLDDNGQKSEATALRIVLFIAFDIPMFPVR